MLPVGGAGCYGIDVSNEQIIIAATQKLTANITSCAFDWPTAYFIIVLTIIILRLSSFSLNKS